MNDNTLRKDFYSVKEFAERMDIHPNTVYKAIKSGHISAFRVGSGPKSSFRIPESEIHRMAMMCMDEVIEKIIEERGK